MQQGIVISKAQLRGCRVSPRKARLVVDMVRGEPVEVALRILKFSKKKSAKLVEQVILSALANAKEKSSVDLDSLVVSKATVDMGRTLKRFLPRAQGRASHIRKRSSHIVVELGLE